MKTESKKIMYGFMLAAAVFLPAIVLAQDPGGGPDAPLDGGLGMLLAAGAAYGIKKYRHQRKQKSTGEEERV